MCFKEKRVIFISNGRPLKLVDKFAYLSSKISSTESNINIRQAKAWTAIDRLSIMWKSDFFQAVPKVVLLYGHSLWTHLMDTPYGQKQNASREKKLDGNYTRMLHAVLSKSWKQHDPKTITFHFKNHPNKTNKTYLALLEKQA